MFSTTFEVVGVRKDCHNSQDAFHLDIQDSLPGQARVWTQKGVLFLEI
jgi:hypothetical protein